MIKRVAFALAFTEIFALAESKKCRKSEVHFGAAVLKSSRH
jgi:hypothetical protein